MAKESGKGGKRPIIIRKEEIAAGTHHGGAWKVAYADFVTAMMAFFLLMWLLNATTEEQRKGLADYFSPANIFSRNSSGSGQPFGGHTAFDVGAMVSDRGAVQVTPGKAPVLPDLEDDDSDTPAKPRPSRKENGTEQDDLDQENAGSGGRLPAAGSPGVAAPGARQRAATAIAAAGGESARRTAAPEPAAVANSVANSGAGKPGPEAVGRDGPSAEETNRLSEAAFRAEQQRREKEAFEQAAGQIRQAVQADPSLAGLSRQLAVDMTPEGLRIQLLDEDRSPMFSTGSSALDERAKLLLQKVAPVLTRLPESISIAGHTDATPYRGTDKTNWELSADRANATRRLLVEAGLPESRIRSVTGNADRDPLLPADPTAAANRRIAIVVLRSAPAGRAEGPPPAAP